MSLAQPDPDADVSMLSGAADDDSARPAIWGTESSIGPYQLLQRIGAGGMGEVWLAEQTQPVRRRVAVKLIKAGMDTREVMARFQSERQTLARMDHPSIAKIFDAGSTAQGRPYFVMEHIAGVPITEYCRQHRMTLRRRLELFVQVCEGVQHAHQKAIIHRDLKPSNILVTEVDGVPVPRIIDFGVAKAISQGSIAETMFTQTDAILGTPAYMSPEQALSPGADVDTRTDVYSLGIVLYELLSGARPFDFQGLAQGEVLRRLRDEEAPRPSTKARMLHGDHGASDLRALAGQLRGDLDAITLKALEKDRSRRYGSPSDLAADIRRYLNQEAVLAIPPSAAYRARKFVGRHRGALATTAAFVLLLMVAVGVSVRQSMIATRQRNRADTEAATARAITEFLQNDLLAQASIASQWAPNYKTDPDLKVRTALDRAAARIAGRFERQPDVEAAIQETIAESYMGMDLYQEARPHLERALDLRKRVRGPEDARTLRTGSLLALTIEEHGDYAMAERLLTDILNRQRRVLGSAHPDTLDSSGILAGTYRDQGKYPQAEALLEEGVRVSRRVFGPDDTRTVDVMNALAQVYYREAKYAQAEALDSEVLLIRRRTLGAEHPATSITLSDLGNVYFSQGRFALAEATYTEVLDIRRRVMGPESPVVMAAMNNLGELYAARGKYAQAEAIHKQALKLRSRVLGPAHPETLMSMENVACAYANLGKYSQAEALFGQTLEIERRALGAASRFTLDALADAILMYQRERKYASAEAYAREALAERQRALGTESVLTMDAAADLALALLSRAKFVEAQPLAREAEEFNRRNRPDDWQRFRSDTLLGASLAGQKKYVEAEPLLVEGYRGFLARRDRVPAPNQYHLKRAREWLIQLYEAWGKPEKAAEWRTR